MLFTELLSCSLLVMTAVATAAASAFYSAPPPRRNNSTATSSADDPEGIETAQVSLGNALAFPLVGSCTLITLFLTWKYVIVQYVLVLVRVLGQNTITAIDKIAHPVPQLMSAALTASLAMCLRSPFQSALDPLRFSRRTTGMEVSGLS